MGILSIVMITFGVMFFIFLCFGIRIVRPTHKMLVETLGKWSRTSESGFTWIIPIIQSGRYINITEQMGDVPPQNVQTKDKLNTEVDAVVFYKVEDVKKSEYNVDDYSTQLKKLSKTTLRAVIGNMTLEECISSRAEINAKVEEILEKEIKNYGVSVLRVEVQRIEPPQSVQESMNDVVKATQEKVAAKDRAIATETEADGERMAAIKEAEGIKKSTILKAEGKAQAFKLIQESFKDKAQLLKKLEVTQASLQKNSKVILTDKGITPQLIVGELPLVK